MRLALESIIVQDIQIYFARAMELKSNFSKVGL